MAVRKLSRREVWSFILGFAVAGSLAAIYFSPPPISVTNNIDASRARDLITNYRTSSPTPVIYGFSIPANIVTNLNNTLSSSPNTAGFQIYYGRTADFRDTSFICVPLDRSGLEMRPPSPTSAYIPNYKVTKLGNHLYSRPCPYACDRNSVVCSCGGME